MFPVFIPVMLIQYLSCSLLAFSFLFSSIHAHTLPRERRWDGEGSDKISPKIMLINMVKLAASHANT